MASVSARVCAAHVVRGVVNHDYSIIRRTIVIDIVLLFLGSRCIIWQSSQCLRRKTTGGLVHFSQVDDVIRFLNGLGRFDF